MSGPLRGLRVIEIAGLGAAPYCGMMLADMGAEVIRVERMPPPPPLPDVLARGRRSIALDLKDAAALDVLLRLVEGCDALFEGFRPGVAERLGFGPETCLERNPRLVYGRMTGWGQEGPLAGSAGHDINYIALSGALHGIGERGGCPVPPLNLVGDFGGGLLLAFGMVCALHESRASGQGQVVDAAMLDAAASFMGMFSGFRQLGMFQEGPGENMLGGAAHFYGTYRTADDRFISIAAIEPEFYRLLIEKLDLPAEELLPYGFGGLGQRTDSSGWEALRERLASVFASRTRDEWCELLEGTDVCFAPVLPLSEAPGHPHNQARSTFVDVDGIEQPAPAPRFSRTPSGPPRPPPVPGIDTREVLAEIGFTGDEIEALAAAGVVPAD
ncbi:MAG: CaiB/BaiF CoA-transferase family protein [Gammaproteobacteria bacterium]|jgi:alpha-methylacyl-CoA racemase